jgi:hypothetical protein
MLRQRLILVGLAIVMATCVAVAILALLPTSSTSAVTKENFDRIQIGMTRAEVEVIFGGKANDFPLWQQATLWEDDETGHAAMIYFDANDCVRRVSWTSSVDDRTPWQKFVDRVLRRKREHRYLVDERIHF